MNRLNELADELTVIRGAIGNVGRHWSAEAVKVIEQTESLLRAAAEETVGTEWNDDPKRFPFPQSSRVRHNADLQAARLAVAAARKERDEAIRLAYHYPPSDPYNPDGVTWRQMYEMLDEKSLGEKHGHACAVATLAEERAALQRAIDEAVAAVQFLSDGTARTVTQILRPHATQREGTKAEPLASNDNYALVEKPAPADDTRELLDCSIRLAPAVVQMGCGADLTSGEFAAACVQQAQAIITAARNAIILDARRGGA